MARPVRRNRSYLLGFCLATGENVQLKKCTNKVDAPKNARSLFIAT